VGSPVISRIGSAQSKALLFERAAWSGFLPCAYRVGAPRAFEFLIPAYMLSSFLFLC